MISDEKLLSRIEKEFNEVQKQTNIKTRNGWTRSFMGKLELIGKEKGYGVFSHSTKKKIRSKLGRGEWLYDLCWAKGKGENSWEKHFDGLKLICESEWNMSKKEILYDFTKLAVGKADLKIMLVQFNDDDKFNKIIKWCESSLSKNLRNDGSRYVLIGSGNKKEKVSVCRLWYK